MPSFNLLLHMVMSDVDFSLRTIEILERANMRHGCLNTDTMGEKSSQANLQRLHSMQFLWENKSSEEIIFVIQCTMYLMPRDNLIAWHINNINLLMKNEHGIESLVFVSISRWWADGPIYNVQLRTLMCNLMTPKGIGWALHVTGQNSMISIGDQWK